MRLKVESATRAGVWPIQRCTDPGIAAMLLEIGRRQRAGLLPIRNAFSGTQTASHRTFEYPAGWALV